MDRLLEHWLVVEPRQTAPAIVIYYAAIAERYRELGWQVAGPYVLREVVEEEIDGRLHVALRDLKALMPTIISNAQEVVRRVQQELTPPHGGEQ